jgi:plastocyanin
MNKNIIITILVIHVLIAASYYFFTKFRVSTLSPELPQPTTQPVSEGLTTPTPPTPQATPTTEATPKEVIIKITANGFEPEEVEITKGTKVTWINEQPNPSWPASAKHPTHEVYPGSSIKKCGTPEQEKIFDACRGLNQGEKWSFVFNEVGEWYYHDHLNPSWKGEIVVK